MKKTLFYVKKIIIPFTLLLLTSPTSSQDKEKSSLLKLPEWTTSVFTDASDLLFIDKFEYIVNRGSRNSPIDPSHKNNPFVHKGGWALAKANNISGSYSGYLYTTKTIPGYKGKFPGKDSQNVLAIEARPSMDEVNSPPQTDIYLQYGDGKTLNAIPGNVWFQFWIYPNNYGNQKSKYGRNNKLIYPCKRRSYPCNDMNWLTRIGTATAEPKWGHEDSQKPYLSTVSYGAIYEPAAAENVYKLGQQEINEYFVPNQWTLVKIHYDTSTTSGVYEAWFKTLGGKWKKVADWRDEKTAKFTWKIPTDKIGGHRMFRMPTTIGYYDSWTYLDDFAIAVSENALPKY